VNPGKTIRKNMPQLGTGKKKKGTDVKSGILRGSEQEQTAKNKEEEEC